MLKFSDVYHANLGRLKAAVDDWTATVTKLETLAEDARTTMLANSKKADWEGVNASVTKSFVEQTAKEFEDAAKAAQGIKKILREGYEAFEDAQDKLKKIVDRDAPDQGLTVGTDGKVSVKRSIADDTTVSRQDQHYWDTLNKEQNAVAAMEKRIEAVLDACDDADQATANALRANITGDKHNLSAPKYTSLDAEEARRAADLAAKGADLTHTQLQQLNELMADNRTSAVFAKTFYEKLGPEKSLAFFGQMSLDVYDGTRLDKQRLKDVQALQRNLGLTLATATDPDKNPHLSEKWGEAFRKLGTERVPLHKYDSSGPYGYQLLGGIMRHGNYDPRFLVPIAEHVVQLQKKDPFMFADSKGAISPNENTYNPSGGNGAGYDPVISMLEALGHSPEAAKEFFSADPKTYDEDGTEKVGPPDLGKGKDGNPITNYLDYFISEGYESFPDATHHGSDNAKKHKEFMPDALGHALEAATLGHAHDDPNPRLHRDATSVAIMEQVVRKIGANAELVKEMEPLADSLGAMGAGYIDDINWAMRDNVSGNVYAPEENPELHAVFGYDNVTKFLSTLGQHPEAYASVYLAENAHMTSMLESQVNPNGKVETGPARSVLQIGNEVNGFLDESRAAQTEAETGKRNEEYNEAMEERAQWIEFGTSTVVGAGVGFLVAGPAGAAAGATASSVLIPLATDTATGAVNEGIGKMIENWSKSEIKEGEESTTDQREEIKKAGKLNMIHMVENFTQRNGIDPNSDVAQDLRESAGLGRTSGGNDKAGYGDTSQTGE
ncbi:hypothetical protein [Streptomyces megasporus]|uniref:hypothetical protein n=1 Tax=Streptomyces megasporus TaxID=44060 RepID=UPI0004E2142B|nr:hypothetical protein [Streptomyces megasporus]